MKRLIRRRPSLHRAKARLKPGVNENLLESVWNMGARCCHNPVNWRQRLGHLALCGREQHQRDAALRAFLCRNGVMTDLGNLGITSAAHGINSKGQVIGASKTSLVPSQASAFLWEKGGPMIDLNTLIPPNSPLHLLFAEHINDHGEIAGIGLPPGAPYTQENVDTLAHALLLVPVGENDLQRTTKAGSLAQ